MSFSKRSVGCLVLCWGVADAEGVPAKCRIGTDRGRRKGGKEEENNNEESGRHGHRAHRWL